jgi:hypothetical protein
MLPICATDPDLPATVTCYSDVALVSAVGPGMYRVAEPLEGAAHLVAVTGLWAAGAERTVLHCRGQSRPTCSSAS